MKERNAVYAGTFDPVTNGHLDIIERASKMYDKLYVTIFKSISKTQTFTLEERAELLRIATAKYKNVIIDNSDILAVEYAKTIGANVLVRGLRATMDFEYEFQMALANQYLDNDVEMVFLMTKANHAYISSSTVKEIAAHRRSVADLVPPCVEEALQKKFQENE